MLWQVDYGADMEPTKDGPKQRVEIGESVVFGLQYLHILVVFCLHVTSPTSLRVLPSSHLAPAVEISTKGSRIEIGNTPH